MAAANSRWLRVEAQLSGVDAAAISRETLITVVR
jgi:hypothetical protein